MANIFRKLSGYKSSVDKKKRKMIEKAEKEIEAQELEGTRNTLKNVRGQSSEATAKDVGDTFLSPVKKRQKEIAVKARKKIEAYRKRTGK